MPWKPGESGNPKGRPPLGETFTDTLRLRANKEEIADKLIEIAKSGNVAALKYVYDRLDGMPHQTQNITMNTELDARWLALLEDDRTDTESETEENLGGLQEEETETSST
jgi:hypothetical protein